MNLLYRIVAIAPKEVRQLRRGRLTVGVIVGLPTLRLLLFGYAINQDVRHLHAGVAELVDAQRSRLLVADAEASQVLKVVKQAESAKELETLLRQSRIAVGVFMPRGILLRGGASLADVQRDLWPLAAFCLATLFLSIIRFRKRLDQSRTSFILLEALCIAVFGVNPYALAS